MVAIDLLQALRDYGADVEGVQARFMDDTELIAGCLQLLVEDNGFAVLGEALAAGDVRTAFDAAHNLKGVAANLGLTPMLDSLVAVVEPLRAGDCQGLEAAYDEVMAQLAAVRALLIK